MSYEEPDEVYSGDELPSEESEDEYDTPALPNRHAATQPKPGGDGSDEDDYEVAIDIKKPTISHHSNQKSQPAEPTTSIGDDNNDEEDNYGVAITNPAPPRPKPKSPPLPPKYQNGSDGAEDQYEVPVDVKTSTATPNDDGKHKQVSSLQAHQEAYEVPVPVVRPPPRRLPSLPPVDDTTASPAVPPRLTTPLAAEVTPSENYEVPTPRERQQQQQQQHQQQPLIEENIDENYEAPIPQRQNESLRQSSGTPPLPPKANRTNSTHVLPIDVKPYKSSSEIESFEINDEYSDEESHYEEIERKTTPAVLRRVHPTPTPTPTHKTTPTHTTSTNSTSRPTSVWVPGPEFPQLNNENQLLFFKEMKRMKETEGSIDESKLMEYAQELKATRSRSGSMSKLLTRTKGSISSLMRKVRLKSVSSSSSLTSNKDDSTHTSPVPAVITEENTNDNDNNNNNDDTNNNNDDNNNDNNNTNDDKPSVLPRTASKPELPPAYVQNPTNNTGNNDNNGNNNDNNNNTDNNDDGADSDGSGYEDVDSVSAAVSRAKADKNKINGDTAEISSSNNNNNNNNDDDNDDGGDSDGSGYEDVDSVSAAVSRAKAEKNKTNGDTVKAVTPIQTNGHTAVVNLAVYTNVDNGDTANSTTNTNTNNNNNDNNNTTNTLLSKTDENVRQELYEDPDREEKAPAPPPRPAPRRPTTTAK